ncbi:MAG: hypothetical protein B6I28_02220 [Fusobacteriia bacterium 4572_132]|nr:MAG: hypothetical protein B6I28_02220 [Fusobacteriia bacterium 4572_132]
MRYTEEIIGQSAGKVWNVLSEKGELNLAALIKETSLKKEDILLAIGWLTKENKMESFKKGRGVSFKLK